MKKSDLYMIYMLLWLVMSQVTEGWQHTAAVVFVIIWGVLSFVATWIEKNEADW